MAVEIKMPSLGTAVDEVRLINWAKDVGEPVKMGEVIAEVETDKAVTELESYAAGVVLSHLVQAGSTVEEGQIIAYVGSEGEQAPEEAGKAAAAEAALESKKPTAEPETRSDGGLRVSPIVRKLAAREGVQLTACTPSGPGGQILRADVLAAKEGESRPAAPAQASSEPIGLSRNQRGVIKRITASHRQQVPIHLNAYIDMTAALRLREELEHKAGVKICFDAIFVWAVGRVLERFPRFKSRMEDGEPVAIAGSGVAVAISPGEELYTPTIPEAATRSYVEIDRDIRALAEKARAGKVTPAEMSGACFTISNLGMYPVSSFDMVVPPEQCAALAIGAIEHRITLEEGRLASAPSVCVTLTCDHRIINGRQAAELLTALKQEMETL